MRTSYRMTYNGQSFKNIDPWNLDNNEGWQLLTGQTDKDTEVYGIVPFIYRVINLTANAVATMPFALVDANGEDYDVTSNWENKAGIMPNPTAFMRLCSLSLCLFGSSYWLKESNRVKVRDLSYLVPSTITPVITAVDGLTGFKRNTGQVVKDFTIKDVIHIWEPDARVEVGPPLAWRLKATLLAGGLLHWEDVFATEFLARGGVKPTMLMVDTPASNPEKTRLEEYWDKFIRGWFKVAGKVFNAKQLNAVPVGDGIDSLQNSTLTPEKREDICVAAGIPLSVVMSNAANFATSQNDRRQFYENVIIPDCDLICTTLNEQLWGTLNPPLYMEPRPETLDAFQEDETGRASAFKTYVEGKMKPEIAAQVVGIELPPGIENYEDMFEAPQPIPAPLAEANGQAQDAPQPDELPTDQEKEQQKEEPPAKAALSIASLHDLDIWKRKAHKAYKRGDPLTFEFTTSAIPAPVYANIAAALSKATTEKEIDIAFSGVENMPAHVIDATGGQSEIKSLLEGIRLGLEALRSETVQPAAPGSTTIVLPSSMDIESKMLTGMMKAIEDMPQPNIVVNVPAQPAPVVNVTMPEQPAPVVTVNVPEQKAPVVNVTNKVQAPEPKPAAPVELTVVRDSLGKITGIKET